MHPVDQQKTGGRPIDRIIVMHPVDQHTNICEQPSDITRHLLLGLSDVCQRVRALTCEPALDHVVLHRSQCHKLASSYHLALQHLEARILQADNHIQIRSVPFGHAKQVLVLSLRSMLQAMQRGERFIRDCSAGAGHTWLLKAVGGLALSAEAVHTHLHDLMWCIYIVTTALERILAEASLDGSTSMVRSYQSLQDLPGWQWGSIIEAAIAAIWENDGDDHGFVDSPNEDLRSVLQVLSKLRADQNIDGNHARLADFLWKRLSEYKMQSNNSAHLDHDGLPESLWIDGATAGLRQHIHDVVGEGAFAKVSKVQWLGGEFALKDFFYVDKVQFGKEAAIQAQLQHPNVLPLICCASSPNRCSLMMELMQEDLLSFMNKRMAARKDPPFSLLEAVDIMLQISKGMEYLHSLNVLHRDLKSNNILVGTGPSLYLDEVYTGHVVQVKVADFGMAKSKQSSSMSSSRVQRGATRWRAPEVFLNEPEDDDDEQDVRKLPKTCKYTKRADVYSFGMVCSEILTGKLPFEKSKLTSLHRRLMAGERPTLPETCPAALVSLIRRCWHGNPLQRPLFPDISRTLLYFKANLLLTNQTDVTISTSPAFFPTMQLAPVMPSLDKTRAAAAYYKSSSLHIVKEMYECRLDDLLQFQRSAQTGVTAHNIDEVQSRPMATNLPTVMEESNLTGHIYSDDQTAPPMQKKSVFGFLARFFCWKSGAAAHRPGSTAVVESLLEQAREFSYAELQLATEYMKSFSQQALASLIRRCWHGNPLQRPLFPDISRTLLYFKANVLLTNQRDVTISTYPAFPPTMQLAADMPSLGKTPAVAPFTKSSSLHIVKDMYQCRLEDLLHKRSVHDEVQSHPMAINLPTVMEEGTLTGHAYSDDKTTAYMPAAPPTQKNSAFGFLARFFCWESGAAHRPEVDMKSFLQQAREFNFTELQLATDNFSRLVGQGGSAKVYWGKLSNGQEIAVKRHRDIHDASFSMTPEFLRELQVLGSLRHRNLVPLLGWCTVGGWFLVYEFMPNGDLSTHLGLSGHADQPIMAWEKRYEIACQLASVLIYLHHDSGYTTIVHRDVKPQNVLLDAHWNSRLSDCGLAILFDSHVLSTEPETIAGTMGFLDPAAMQNGGFGTSSDVFAFGVTALVVASGKNVRNFGSQEWDSSGPVFLRDWVYALYEEGELLAAGDSRLRQCFDEEQMRRLLVVGLACTAYNPLQRPTMQLVLDVLKGTTSYDRLNVPANREASQMEDLSTHDLWRRGI